jgi:hypothetical protein
MAEEGTLGLARAGETSIEETSKPEPSKEELQRRMGEARQSISQTVAEIKDNVVHQYESVKETISETLDWREQFKKRPVAWTAGAAGAGFLTGYCVTAMIKGDNDDAYEKGYEQARQEIQASGRRSYAAQSLAAPSQPTSTGEVSGPGFIERIQDTRAFDKVKHEAADIGGHLVDQVSKTAKDVVVPALIGMLTRWLEDVLPKKSQGAQARSLQSPNLPPNQSKYQPVTERQP